MILPALGACALLILVAVVAWIVEHETKRRKPNIRVPRETLWGRTHKYHMRTK